LTRCTLITAQKQWQNTELKNTESSSSSLIFFITFTVQYRNLCDTVISNEKEGAVKGREVFGSNDTQIRNKENCEKLLHIL